MKSRRSFLASISTGLIFAPKLIRGATSYTANNQSHFQGTVPVTAAPLTISCWFNIANVTTDCYLVSVGDFDTNNYFFLQAGGSIGGDPVLAATRDGAATRFAQSTAGYTASTWYHVCGVFASSTSRTIYLSGGNSATNTTAATPTGLDYIAINGIRVSNAWFATGAATVAEVGIWNADLSADEVVSLAMGFLPSKIRPQNLRFYVPGIREIIDVRGGLSLIHAGNSVAVHPRRIF